MTGADLTHIDTWLFDLDNTLYPEESGFMRQAEGRMTAYVEKVTGLPHAEAYALQKRYLAEHGLTLGGLMQNHGVDPDEYHTLFHDLPLEALAQTPELVAAIARLPGRRLIFTNADAIHAARVLDHLGLAHLFHDVFHIESFGFVPKPNRLAFERMIESHQIEPSTTAFFEDSEANLAPAAALGMTTVLVGLRAAGSKADFVQYRTEKLAPFLDEARLKKAAR
jgi:putative hydrolase of the HAD superfamily